MPWHTSQHRQDLPPDWHARRAHTWRTAHGQCQHTTDGTRCTWTGRLNGDGGQCDHITNTATGGTHDLSNLQWLCPTHHKTKTRAEAQEAQAARPSRRRTPERHPGLI